ncbi:molecular chaperone [Enterobacter sp. UNJFSC 003]|uniref:fimbrial biogenesis chaperone n=1 Tax=Enterobacter sp. UNJFSC 003 TaxID=3122077 RepID=UPI002EA7D7E7|nr:molecular chaperone [Serratia liquefaciens]
MKYLKALSFLYDQQSRSFFSVALLCIIGMMHNADAAGITLSGTRLIYPQGAAEVTLNSTNTSQKQTYLVQSWISDEKGEKVSDFIVTPPLFTLKPGAINVLRVMYTGQKLPADRESVFYFNNKAIPSLDKKVAVGNTLQIATQSVIKLFYRPAHLTVKTNEAPAMLHCQVNGDVLTVSNPTPYYITLVNFTANGQKLPNTMIAPKGSQVLKTARGPVTYQTLNDYGAVTPVLTCNA